MTDSQDESLAARLRAVEDRQALLEIEGAYGRTYDSGDGEAWAALFTDDGIYQSRELPGMPPGNLVRGRENLARFCRTHRGTGIHTVHLPTLAIDGDTARGRTHFKFDGSHTDELGRIHYRHSTGYYDVAYARTEGSWRITRRITTIVDVVARTTLGYEPSAPDFDAPPTEGPEENGYRDARP